MTESYPETAASPTPAPRQSQATPTDPSALASPVSSKSRSNRRNALKSTGPRSVAGKARFSDNALSLGFLSRHLPARGPMLASGQGGPGGECGAGGGG